MKTAAQEFFAGLKGKNISVIGVGVSNNDLIRRFAKEGACVTLRDGRGRDQLGDLCAEFEALGVALQLGEGYLDGLNNADMVVRAPGVYFNKPELVQARRAGVPVTSEMELFLELCPCPVYAVTGSDGKTTTTSIIAEMLKAAGFTVHLGGNIGRPLLTEVDGIRPDHVAVVELSSFQLMYMRRSPGRALITNLSPNHLDVHKDMEEYVEAKKNIYRFQKEGDLLIVNADNAITAPLRGPGETRTFSRQGRGHVELREGVIFRGEDAVLPVSDILLPGVHNVENYMAAIALVEGLVSDDAIRQVAKNFGGVEHRIELVRVKDGVRYYNDSIASSPSRTIAGLRSFPEKVILIAGGYDKHIPYDVLGPEICDHVKKLFLCGATGPKIRAAVEAAEGEKPEIIDCADLEAATRAAAAAAKSGDVVIMSPASASFDAFKNFMVRGEFFKKIVKEL